MIVVSNSSPLISLGAIGRLDLLHEIFGEVSIPLAVLQEVNSVETSTETWIIPREAHNLPLSRALESELDRGEAEAIALAIELGADLLLMDERRGRQLASRLGLKVFGVLGILVDSKRIGLIEKVGPVLVELREKVGFRISTALYERALQEAGEGERG